MDIDLLFQLISSYGFPMIACGLMGWYIWKQQEKNNQTIKELSDVIEKNTRLLERILDKIGDIK